MKDLTKFNNNLREKPAPKGKQADSAVVAVEQVQAVQVKLITISEEDVGQRIDNFLLKKCKGVPKSHVYQILRSGQVRVNKGRINQLYRLKLNDVVRIPPVRIAEKKVESEFTKAPKAEFTILFEDTHLLIIDKPSGVAVHGGSGVSYGVIEQLRAARPEAKFLELVHRLDRETSGILLLAKKRSALTNLHEQMREGLTDKRYLTLIRGEWRGELRQRQHIKLPLHKYTAADGERRVRVQADGMASHTVFTLLRRYGEFALLEAELKTGRTHQIRVHLSASGFAIAGDEKYGDFALNRQLLRSENKAEGRVENKVESKVENKRIPLKRMFLHAHQITFTHPETGKEITVKSPLPKECERFLTSLGDG